MMKNILILAGLLCAISATAFSQHQGYEINGNVTGFPDSTWFYLKNINTDETFDSAMLVNNQFQFKGSLGDEPEQIWLNTLIGYNFYYTNLLIGNDHITITGDMADFPWDVTINGSGTQDDYNELRNLTSRYDRQRDGLVKGFLRLPQAEQQEKRKEVWGTIHAIDDTIFNLRLQYIKSHINTYPAIIYLGYYKERLPKDTVQILYDQLTQEMQASKYARIVDVYLRKSILSIGDTYQDFKACNQQGDTVLFSELMGKHVLLDFTSAFCAPCVQAAKELRYLDSAYSQNLTVVSFSVDLKKTEWLRSLTRDKATWTSLWDGQGRFGDTYIGYGVHALPTFVLIDPKGIILDKWKGYRKGSLQERLQQFNIN